MNGADYNESNVLLSALFARIDQKQNTGAPKQTGHKPSRFPYSRAGLLLKVALAAQGRLWTYVGHKGERGGDERGALMLFSGTAVLPDRPGCLR